MDTKHTKLCSIFTKLYSRFVVDQSSILQGIGAGMAVEERRAWAGWWNEEVVDLVRETMHDPRALGVLLTGRNKERFGNVLQCMFTAKGLKFDLVSLRTDEFKDTIQFKLACLNSLLEYYRSRCKAVYVYEDRAHHVSIFRDFYENGTRQMEQI